MRFSKVLIVLVVIAAAAGAGRFYLTGQGAPRAGAAPGGPPPAMPVPVVSVLRQTLPIYLDYSARLESIRNIQLQARVNGYLMKQVVPDGTNVKEGALLYQIDPRDLQAALEQAKAQVARDTAARDYAKANYTRGTELVKSGVVTKDTFDQRDSAMQQAEAALLIDNAAVRVAELNLSYAEIRAPFAGRLGRNLAPIGTLISAAGTPLNTLVQFDPIYVAFTPTEADLTQIEAARRRGKVDVDVIVPGEQHEPHRGELTFLDNVVDRTTGTIIARATLPNADSSITPGQYVRVRVHVVDQQNALMVPQSAIGSSQLGKYVYVIGDNNTADQRMVELGRTDGELVNVTKGVKETDSIIVGNLQKIGPGSPVAPAPAPAPALAAPKTP